MKMNQTLLTWLFLLVATILEVCGDALVRKSMYEYSGTYRLIATVVGTALLFGYGFMLNLAPVEFGKVVGLYIATLFVIWQVINYIVFHTIPPMSVLVGGGMIIVGGLIVSFGKF